MILIIPAAADKSGKPYIFDSDASGELLLCKSLLGISLSSFNSIYITLLNKHTEKYALLPKLEQAFKRHSLWERVKITLLEESASEPYTIAETIKRNDIKGEFMIKDTDNYFQITPIAGNYICAYPLDLLKRVNPSNKSYIELDYSMYVTNIIEKRIIGRYFCVGGYCFKSTDVFLNHYEKLLSLKDNKEFFYLSHIIFSMLMQGESFRPLIVSDYIDWGTEEEWKEYKTNH